MYHIHFHFCIRKNALFTTFSTNKIGRECGVGLFIVYYMYDIHSTLLHYSSIAFIKQLFHPISSIVHYIWHPQCTNAWIHFISELSHSCFLSHPYCIMAFTVHYHIYSKPWCKCIQMMNTEMWAWLHADVAVPSCEFGVNQDLGTPDIV